MAATITESHGEGRGAIVGRGRLAILAAHAELFESVCMPLGGGDLGEAEGVQTRLERFGLNIDEEPPRLTSANNGRHRAERAGVVYGHAIPHLGWPQGVLVGHVSSRPEPLPGTV